jgi:hypothetical protein
VKKKVTDSPTRNKKGAVSNFLLSMEEGSMATLTWPLPKEEEEEEEPTV